MEFIKNLTQDQLSVFQKITNRVLTDLDSKSNNSVTKHVLFFDDSKEDNKSKIWRKDYLEIEGIIKTILNRLCNNFIIISSRLVINEPGCPSQSWHIDYKNKYINVLFICLTNSTANNTTEYISTTECGNYVVIKPIVKTGSVVKMQGGTIHRRAHNTTNNRRIFFAIDYYKKKPNIKLSYTPETQQAILTKKYIDDNLDMPIQIPEDLLPRLVVHIN